MSPLFLAIDYVSERAAIKTVERKSRERKTRRMKCHEKKIAKKIECRSFVFLWICPFSFLWCGVGATFVGAVLAISTVCAPTDAIAFYSNDFLSTWSWQETRLAFTLFNDPQVQPLRFLTAPFSCKPWLLQFIRLQRRVQVCRFLKQEHLDFSDSMQDAVSVSPRDLDINPQQQPFFLFCLFDTIWLPISDKKKNMWKHIYLGHIYSRATSIKPSFSWHIRCYNVSDHVLFILRFTHLFFSFCWTLRFFLYLYQLSGMRQLRTLPCSSRSCCN